LYYTCLQVFCRGPDPSQVFEHASGGLAARTPDPTGAAEPIRA
jgi:hypothetical protein